MKRYRDFYGCTATVHEELGGHRLRMRVAGGKCFYDKMLKSERACKQVMSRFSDGTMQEV